MNLPHFRMPRAIDPRRHHEVRAWADAERHASQHTHPLGTRERIIYGVLFFALAAILIAAAVRAM
jgi:hypothetical protein